MPHPGRQQRLDGRRDGGAVDDVLDPGERDRAAHRLLPPSSMTAPASPAGSRAALPAAFLVVSNAVLPGFRVIMSNQAWQP